MKIKPIYQAEALESSNIRDGASLSSAIIGAVEKGQKLLVLERLTNGWYKVYIDEDQKETGYVCNIKNKYFADRPLDAAQKTASVLPKMQDEKMAGTYITLKKGAKVMDNTNFTSKCLVVLPANVEVTNYGFYQKNSQYNWLWVHFNYKKTEYSGYIIESSLQKINE